MMKRKQCPAMQARHEAGKSSAAKPAVPGRQICSLPDLKEGPLLSVAELLLIALVTAVYAVFVAVAGHSGWTATELEAARLMRGAEAAVASCRRAEGWKPDPEADPNATGMIGEEYGDYTTSLGNLYAKRTGTDPRMAALMARLYREAGVQKGDAVAVGASGSFPSLTIASLAAAKAMGARAIIIPSIGASTWGCDIQGFTNIDLMRWLADSPVSGFVVAGVSMGGDGDRMPGLFPEARDLALKLIAGSGFYFIDAADTRASVRERLRLYDKCAAALDCRLACYVNVGGNIANMGSGNDVLNFRPGLIEVPVAGVPVQNRGVIHEMSLRNIPTIHLLNLKGLCQRYSLPWDPMPLFNPDRPGQEKNGVPAGAAAAAYIIVTAAIIIAAIIRKKEYNK